MFIYRKRNKMEHSKEFLEELRQLCLEHDKQISGDPEYDFEGLEIYMFAINNKIYDDLSLEERSKFYEVGIEWGKQVAE